MAALYARLAAIDRVAASGSLGGYYLVAAARADALRRLGRRTEAATEYRRALESVLADPEHRFLAKRLREVEAEDVAADRAVKEQ